MCTCIFKGLLSLWEPFSPSHSVISGIKGLYLASPSATAIHPGCMRSLYHSWMTPEADSIPNSSLWLWLALLKSTKNTAQWIPSAVRQSSSADSECETSFVARTEAWQVVLLPPLTAASGPSSFSQEPMHWARISADTKSSPRHKACNEVSYCCRGIRCVECPDPEGSVLGSLGKITLHEPLLCVHDTDLCTWFHSLFTKSLSDFCFMTPTTQTRKTSIEKKSALSHLAFWELIWINILNHYVYYLFIYSNFIPKNSLFMIDQWDKQALAIKALCLGFRQ